MTGSRRPNGLASASSVDESHFPGNMGIVAFLKRYSEAFAQTVESYHEGHWELTQLLERMGRGIVRSEVPADECSLFLLLIGLWKKPHRNAIGDITRNFILSNSRSSVREAIRAVVEIHRGGADDREYVAALRPIKGLGAAEDRTPMLSACLRFLFPELFGAIDYRNWCVLSNTEYDFFEARLVSPPLAETWEAARGVPITTDKFLAYTRVVRELAEDSGLTPAEVDMALFSFASEIKPFHKVRVVPKLGARKLTAMKMMIPLWRVMDTARAVGMDHAARKMVNNIIPALADGNPTRFWQECQRMVGRNPLMDRVLLGAAREAGIKDATCLADQLKALEAIREDR